MTRRSRTVAQPFVLTVILAIFWVACVSTMRLNELLVGLGAVLVSVSSCLFVVDTLPLQFRPKPREIAQAWRVPGDAFLDLIQIALVLVRDFKGSRAPSLFRSAPWGPVKNNGSDTAKRALAVTYTTVSPNCIVVGIDCGRHQVLFHQLKKSPVSTMMRKLGTGSPQ